VLRPRPGIRRSSGESSVGKKFSQQHRGKLAVRLTRSNDDPTLLDDLERLARIHGDPDREPRPLSSELTPAEVQAQADAEAAAAEAAAADGDAAEPTVLDDPFVRRFVQVSVHLKRYAPFYAGAAVWAMAMLLIQPLGGDRKDAADLASSSTPAIRRTVPAPAAGTAVDAAAVSTTETAAPLFDDFGGSGLSSTSSSSFSTFDDSSDLGDSGSSTFASSDDSSSSGSASFDDSEFSSFDDEESSEPLAIVASGYASATGGTPLEQDPGAGILPVAATGGNTNKRSYLRLEGDETTLVLKEAAEGQLRSDAGGVKACLLTADWQPARGAALSAGPAYDENNCSTGVRAGDGTWTFDLSSFAPLADAKGFALTPAAGTASTFEVRFVGTAVPPAG
jgi:hypothetical protein